MAEPSVHTRHAGEGFSLLENAKKAFAKGEERKRESALQKSHTVTGR